MRIKAKTCPTGYIALVNWQGYVDQYEFPVARFDDDGYAMIADPDTGRLVRAADMQGFREVTPMWQVTR